MIAYLDSSVLARAYLPDEDGHEQAVTLLEDPHVVTVTGTWSRIEVSGALVRAARDGRGDEEGLLALLDEDLDVDGPVTLLAVPQEELEERALALVRAHGLRAMDAWHLAAAAEIGMTLLEAGESMALATRDGEQARLAEELGFVLV
ncbi:MAG: type II toxin-antitoxin system VapC family toxin [Actinomycetota bacterium]|jgi:predicted nucleic acid-binding protein|nr:type II toxin-antitoxin system VapC family toxin [Actinomycetota bacterium]